MSKIIGITGGIASGKSTVVAEICKAGYRVIDADQVVHGLQAREGKLYQVLVGHFGQEILDGEGHLNRSKLAQLIFASPENVKVSSTLQDQIIREELARQRDKLAQTEDLFFMDIPLLIELDYQDWFDEIWLVYVDEERQLQRLMARNGYSREEAQQRLASQMPLADKVKFADVIIDNSGNLENTKKIVYSLLENLQEK